jgi:hypothetical protein
MKILKQSAKLLLLLIIMNFGSSCSYRIADLTIASTKLHTIQNVEQLEKRGVGKSFGLFGEGASLGDAIDDALLQTGPEFDLLIDVVIRCKSYLVAEGFVVEGTAMDSKPLMPLYERNETQN